MQEMNGIADDPGALLRAADGLYAAGRVQEAGRIYQRLLQQSPQKLFLLNRLAEIAATLNKHGMAVQLLRRSLALAPNQAPACTALGTALSRMGRVDEALAAYDRVISLEPQLAKAHNLRGLLLGEARRLSESVESFDRAIAIDPQFAAAHGNRGAMLKQLDRFDEALESFDRAVEIQPAAAALQYNRARMYGELGRSDEALAGYEAAIAAKPDYARAYVSKAELLLLRGDYVQGWKLYEWRHAGRARPDDPLFAGLPLWTGEQDVAGRTVVIRPEVGFGDFIMFARYAKPLRQRGANVVVYAQAALAELCRSLGDGISVVKEGEPLPPADLYCPIMDLPRAFGTTLQTVPAQMPYVAADPQRVDRWREKLGPAARPRVGLMWSGKGDRNIDRTSLRRRSMPAQALQPLVDLPFEFHALQKEFTQSDGRAPEILRHITTHESALHDFADTAALIEQMDLVISIDTSVAHLAGALGKPLWVALPFHVDYRWTAAGPATPWYPTATLFRLSAPGDWHGVTAAMAARLAQHFSGR
jgi:tetratricopeptide (TPR) repeat protein